MSLYYHGTVFALVISTIVLLEGIIFSFGLMVTLLPGFTAICAGILLLLYTLHLVPAPIKILITSSIASIVSGWLAAFLAGYIMVGPPTDEAGGLKYAIFCVGTFLLAGVVVSVPLWWTIKGMRWIQRVYYTPVEREVLEYMRD